MTQRQLWTGWQEIFDRRINARKRHSVEAARVLVSFLATEAPRLYVGENVTDLNVDAVCALQDKLLLGLDLETRMEAATQFRLGLSRGNQEKIWWVPLPDLELRVLAPSALVRPVDFVTRRAIDALMTTLVEHLDEIVHGAPRLLGTLLRIVSLCAGGLLKQAEADKLIRLGRNDVVRINGLLVAHLDRDRYSSAWFPHPLAELILWMVARGDTMPITTLKSSPRLIHDIRSLSEYLDNSKANRFTPLAMAQLERNFSGAFKAELFRSAAGVLLAHASGLNRTHPLRRTTLYRLIFDRPLRHDLPATLNDPPEIPDSPIAKIAPPPSIDHDACGPGELLVSEVQTRLHEFAELPGRPSTEEVLCDIGNIIAKYPEATPMARALVAWVMKNLETEHANRKKASTIYHELNQIWRGVLAVETEGVPSPLDKSGWGVFLASVFLLLANRKTAPKALAALRNFHHSVVADNLSPDIDYAEIEGFSAHGEAFDPNLVTPADYREALLRLEADTKQDAWLITVRQLATILGFRCGLRREEIMFLEIRSIERGDNPLLIIEDTHRRSLKTAAGNRRLPLRALLDPDEFSRLMAYVDQRRQETGTESHRLLFAGTDDEPLTDFRLFVPIQQTLREATGDSSIVFHHLRHSFVTWLLLRLIFSRSPHLLDHRIQVLTDPMFSEDACHTLRKSLYRERQAGASDPGARDAYLVTLLVGHSTPAITLKSYFHFADWLVSRVVSQGSPLLSSDVVSRLLDVSSASVSRLRKLDNDNQEKLSKHHVSISTVNRYLAKDGVFRDIGVDDVTLPRPNLTELQHAVHFRAEIAQIRHAGRLIRNPPCDWLEILKCMTKVGDRLAELTNEAVESLNIPAATVLQWCARIGSIQSQKKGWRTVVTFGLPHKGQDMREYEATARAILNQPSTLKAAFISELEVVQNLLNPVTGAFVLAWNKAKIAHFTQLLAKLGVSGSQIVARVQLGRSGAWLQEDALSNLGNAMAVNENAVRFKYDGAKIASIEEAIVEIFVMKAGKTLKNTERINQVSFGFRAGLTACVVFRELFV